MMLSIDLATEAIPAAHPAAQWVAAFHPDVSVAVDGQSITLFSVSRSKRALNLIWNVALANERLLAGAAEFRAEVIGALVA